MPAGIGTRRRIMMTLLAAAFVAIFLVGLVSYFEAPLGTQGGVRNTYVHCSITGVGGFEFRVVSDSTGSPVSGETIKAVNRLGCGSDNQVVYLDSFSQPEYCCNFTETNGGWLVPDFPSQATVGGLLDFTVTYQGVTYTFDSGFPPVGTNCVTLHVPSGNATTVFVMNGSGSYCS